MVTSPPAGSALASRGRRCAVDAAGRGGPCRALLADGPPVLDRVQSRRPVVLVDPQQQVAAGGVDPSLGDELRRHPAKRRLRPAPGSLAPLALCVGASRGPWVRRSARQVPRRRRCRRGATGCQPRIRRACWCADRRRLAGRGWRNPLPDQQSGPVRVGNPVPGRDDGGRIRWWSGRRCPDSRLSPSAPGPFRRFRPTASW